VSECVCVSACVRVRACVCVFAVCVREPIGKKTAFRVHMLSCACSPCVATCIFALRCPSHWNRHSGCSGRLIKRTAKGARVLLEDGAVAWIPTKGYTRALPSWGAATMPAELLVHVFSHLTQREVARAAEVCKWWRDAAWSPTLWRDWNFYEITALNYRWVQRRFLSYGLFMKARRGCARSLRLLVRSDKKYAALPDGTFKRVYSIGPIAPLSDKVADAKPLLWHLNHFFEGVDCSGLRTILLGLLEIIGPLSEIAPVVRGAGSLLTLKLHTRNPRTMGDCIGLELSKLNSLHIHSGNWGAADGSAQDVYEHGPGGSSFSTDLNRVLAACPRLRELSVYECGTDRATPYALASQSVEVLHCEGKGLRDLIGLDMPSLQHCTLEVWDCEEGALPTTSTFAPRGHCSYDLFRPLTHLKSVTVGSNLFEFPAERGVRSTRNTAVEHKPWGSPHSGFVEGLPLCHCAVCAATDGEGAGAAQ
jgi:hypothetical protein